MEPITVTAAAALLASSMGAGEMQTFQIDPGAQLCKSTPAIEGGQPKHVGYQLTMEPNEEARAANVTGVAQGLIEASTIERARLVASIWCERQLIETRLIAVEPAILADDSELPAVAETPPEKRGPGRPKNPPSAA